MSPPELFRLNTTIFILRKLTMKHITRITILTLAISGLLAGRNVLAEPTDASALVKPNPPAKKPKNVIAGKKKNSAWKS